MLAALELEPAYYTDLRRDYTLRRNFLLGELSAAGFYVEPPEGTYFMLADYSAHAKVPDMSFAIRLTEQHGVAAIPISVFYSDPAAAAASHHYVRFAFCKDHTTLRAAGRRLRCLTANFSESSQSLG